jgi:EF hand domain-containing protein
MLPAAAIAVKWILFIGFFACSAAWAQSDKDEQFRELDLNGDGVVSLAEAAGNAEVVTKFDRADRNKDGKLSRAEFDRLDRIQPRVAKAKGGRSAATGGTRERR